MSSIRDLSTSVNSMKQEIKTSIENISRHSLVLIDGRYQTLPAAVKKIDEAKRFLETINRYEYSKCKTVYDLILQLQKVRNALNKEHIIIESKRTIMPQGDYRLEMREAENTARNIALRSEIQWLDKCISIAKNKKYFDY